MHPGAEENDVTQRPCMSPVSLFPWYFTGKAKLKGVQLQKEVLAGLNAKPGSYVFALATHKGRLLLVLSCISGSGENDPCHSSVIDSALKVLKEYWALLLCTCMGMHVHV